MAGGQTGGVIGQVDRLLRLGTVAAMTPGQLLERFAADRDEASFTALVAIHGPMVLGVCRRALADPDDSDDAFQATFLVLARKAGSIRRPDLLGPWLHGVARRVAGRMRSLAARRKAVERPGAELVAMTRDDDGDRHELGAVLDEEIGRLPERFRRPLVLCYLEGRTQEEAARDLKWTAGTLRGRLAKAREILRSRLTRRGLAPSGGCLMGLSPTDVTPAAVPPPLAMATVRAAISFAARSTSAGPVSASAASVAEGVLKTMIVTPMKIAATALLAAAGLVALPYLSASEPRDAPPSVRAKAPAAAASVSPAEEVMARMVKAYAEARSYRDEGEVTLVFTDPLGKHTQKKPFATKFVRPKLFRFEFTERDSFEETRRYVIWSDAAPERAKTWWTIRPKVEEASLPMAVGAAAGVSSLSSLTIPRLLMPRAIQGHSPADLKGLKLVDIENVDGVPCDKVEGTNLRGDVETVWIDKASSLVRKVSGTSKIPGASVEQTTIYRPQINVEIAPKEFAFEPPKP